MLVYLHEANTGAVFNGIVRSQDELNALIRNFIYWIKLKYHIDEKDMRLSIT